MDGRIEGAYSLLRAVFREVRREDVTFMAASIAYHAFVSMLPIFLVLTLAASTVGAEQFATRVVEFARGFLPEAGREVVTEALVNASASTGASVVGGIALLWGTAKVFRAMDAAFAEIYDTERRTSVLDQLQDAVVVLVALLLAVAGIILVGSFVTVPASVPFPGVFNALMAVVGLSIAFFPMYYVFPNIDVSIDQVIPGVLVAAVGWVALEWLFGFYVGITNKPDAYGLLGTLLVLITWLYVGSLVLLVGAALNATLAGRCGDPSGPRGKRRFGREVDGREGFEQRLDRLVGQARDADVPDSAIRRTLRRRAEDQDGVEGPDPEEAVAAGDGTGNSSGD